MSGCYACMFAEIKCKKCVDRSRFVNAEIMDLLDEAYTRIAGAAILLDHMGEERAAAQCARTARKISEKMAG
jgi:hypothetical protein